MNRITWILLAAGLALAACGPSGQGGSPAADSGIEGTITLGPACPVVNVDNPCPDQPYQAAVTVLTPDGQALLTFTSDEQGYFKVDLAPGDYVLRPQQGQPFPLAGEQAVQVLAGEYTRVTITFDSGIR